MIEVVVDLTTRSAGPASQPVVRDNVFRIPGSPFVFVAQFSDVSAVPGLALKSKKYIKKLRNKLKITF